MKITNRGIRIPLYRGKFVLFVGLTFPPCTRINFQSNKIVYFQDGTVYKLTEKHIQLLKSALLGEVEVLDTEMSITTFEVLKRIFLTESNT